MPDNAIEYPDACRTSNFLNLNKFPKIVSLRNIVMSFQLQGVISQVFQMDLENSFLKSFQVLHRESHDL